jgi:hypothetical protein
MCLVKALERRIAHRRLSRDACRNVIAMAADLSVSKRIDWRVDERYPAANPASLSVQLGSCRRVGGTFYLPTSVRAWFRVGFAIPNAAYSLALLYLWAMSAGAAAEAHDAGSVAERVLVWYLRTVMPHKGRAELPLLERAVRSAALTSSQ